MSYKPPIKGIFDSSKKTGFFGNQKDSQKAQASGTGAAALVAIIGGLIVIYILVLPPAEREKILSDQEGTSIGGAKTKVTAKINETLLVETPGRLDFLEEEEIEHLVP